MPERDYVDTPQRETQINSAFYRLESAADTLSKEFERLEQRLSAVRSAGPKNAGNSIGVGTPLVSVPMVARIDKTSHQLNALLERVLSLQAELEI